VVKRVGYKDKNLETENRCIGILDIFEEIKKLTSWK